MFLGCASKMLVVLVLLLSPDSKWDLQGCPMIEHHSCANSSLGCACMRQDYENTLQMVHWATFGQVGRGGLHRGACMPSSWKSCGCSTAMVSSSRQVPAVWSKPPHLGSWPVVSQAL